METNKEQLTLTVEQGTKGDVVGDNVYIAQVTDVHRMTMEFGEAVRISFKILEGVETGKSISGIAKFSLNEKTKLFAWLKSLGLSLDVGQQVDLNGIIGRRCRVLTKMRSKSSQTGEILRYSNVVEVLPDSA